MSTKVPPGDVQTDQEGTVPLDFATASFAAVTAAALAGMPPKSILSRAGSAPLPIAAARVAQPASVIWAPSSTPVGGGSASAGSGGATGAVRPSSPSEFPPRKRYISAGRRRRAGARATSPASVMLAAARPSLSSRGRAPRPRAAASAEAPASPTCTLAKAKVFTEGSAAAPSPSASRCTPSGPAALPDLS
eukprot:scaffold88466_cov67-Phaeocystis_antarctica.AAC.5